MREIYDALYKEVGCGRAAALVTVMSSSGSVPRGAGAVMAVFERAPTVGTVGGGSIEHRAEERAKQMLRRPANGSSIETYTLTAGDAAGLGMVCGGTASLLFEIFAPADDENISLLRSMAAAFGREGPSWYARKLSGGRVTAARVLTGDNFDENFPEETLAPVMRREAAYMDGEPAWFVARLTERCRAIVYGGGHVSRELVPLLAKCGFRVTVCEDREQFAREEYFPGAEKVLLCGFDALPDKALPGAEDFAVVVTRGHEADFDVLSQVLKTPAVYVGCIGSRKKAQLTRERLLEAGFADGDVARVRSPVGLAIGAETPAEIAVSIAAEMIQTRAAQANGAAQ